MRIQINNYNQCRIVILWYRDSHTQHLLVLEKRSEKRLKHTTGSVISEHDDAISEGLNNTEVLHILKTRRSKNLQRNTEPPVQ